MNSSRSLFPTALLVSLLMVLCFCAPAFADSLAVKQAEADHVQAQIGRLNDKAEIASERYNQAQVRYNTVTDKVRTIQKKIDKLQKQQKFLQGHLNTRVEDMYRKGPLDFLTVLLSVRSFDDYESTMRVLSALNQQDAGTVSQLRAAKSDAYEAKKTLVAAQTEAHKQKVAMAENKAAVEQQLAARKQLLASLSKEIQQLVVAQIAHAAAAEQARTMATLMRSRSLAEGGIIFGGNPPTSSKAAAAVYWAEKQIGKPYVWAAAGPDTFDCSGLMMWSYAHVGITLNHYSGDQINEGKRVDRSDLEPGDLVFFGSPIHHVGMYVGGGNFVEAPYTGTTVRITPLSNRGDFAGACRPAE
jgi:cell wall-associated NlpC family hydrolase